MTVCYVAETMQQNGNVIKTFICKYLCVCVCVCCASYISEQCTGWSSPRLPSPCLQLLTDAVFFTTLL